jgi:hypothetical protein
MESSPVNDIPVKPAEKDLSLEEKATRKPKKVTISKTKKKKQVSKKEKEEESESKEAPETGDQATGEARGAGAEARGNSEESKKIKDADASPEPRAPSTDKDADDDVDRKESDEWVEEHEKHERRGRLKRTAAKAIVIAVVIILIVSVSIVYLYYERFDTDSDGILDWDDDDDDGDGMPDSWENDMGFDPLDADDGKADADQDNLTNKEEYVHTTDPFDPDSDDDGLKDGDELPLRTDPLNPDSDGDTLPDGWEAKYGLNPMDASDATQDPDHDGFEQKILGKIIYFNYTNLQEHENNTNPTNPDTDGDLMYDGWELHYSSELGVIKKYNTDLNISFDPLSASDGAADYDLDFNYDIIGDDMTNSQEFLNDTNPLRPDSDGDELDDGEEVIEHNTDPNWYDTDDDLLSDGWEVEYGLNPLDPDSDSNSVNDSREDRDDDGLSNFQEYVLGTHPFNNDTDSDGMSDGWEVDNHLNPLKLDHKDDLDNDSLPNLLEKQYGTDPLDPDSDDDTLTDGEEVLVGWYGELKDGIYIVNETVSRYFTNPLKKDSDSDGLFDYDEIRVYFSNATNNDTDGDGLLDAVEEKVEGTNASRVDSDSDGLTDLEELDGIYGYITLPMRADTDGDGLNDGDEIFTDFLPGGKNDSSNPQSVDTDGDGIPDGWEAEYGKTTDYDLISRYDSDYGTNIMAMADPDKDGTVNNPVWLVNPIVKADGARDPDHDSYDINGDGSIHATELFTSLKEYTEYSTKFGVADKYTDPLDWDSDGDKMSDHWELYFASGDPMTPDPLDGTDALLDNDHDFVKYFVNSKQYTDDYNNLEEYRSGIDLNGDGIIDSGSTDPNDDDSDNNGKKDYDEFWYADHDGDGLHTGWELIFNGTSVHAPNGYNPSFASVSKGQFNPFSNDTDGDLILDGQEDQDGDDIKNVAEHGNPAVAPGSSDPTDPSSVPSRSSRSTDQMVEEELRMVDVAEISHTTLSNLQSADVYRLSFSVYTSRLLLLKLNH